MIFVNWLDQLSLYSSHQTPLPSFNKKTSAATLKTQAQASHDDRAMEIRPKTESTRNLHTHGTFKRLLSCHDCVGIFKLCLTVSHVLYSPKFC